MSSSGTAWPGGPLGQNWRLKIAGSNGSAGTKTGGAAPRWTFGRTFGGGLLGKLLDGAAVDNGSNGNGFARGIGLAASESSEEAGSRAGSANGWDR